jgi:hypothetical protein
VADDVWAKLRDLGNDIHRFASAVEECAKAGHVYRLHAGKRAPTRVTCKRCPAEWRIEQAVKS